MNPILTKEGCPTPFEVPVKKLRKASLGPELERSEIHEADLDRLRSIYSIPDDFRMTIPGSDNKVVSSSWVHRLL